MEVKIRSQLTAAKTGQSSTVEIPDEAIIAIMASIIITCKFQPAEAILVAKNIWGLAGNK